MSFRLRHGLLRDAFGEPPFAAVVAQPFVAMEPVRDELEEGLIARRRRAIVEGWHGEVEGLDLTLAFLRSKRNQTRRMQRAGSVTLGMPTLPHQRPTVPAG